MTLQSLWRLALVLCLGLLSRESRAHFCGPGEFTIAVGQTLTWQITADLTELETTYTPTITGSNGVAQIFPSAPFNSRHGEFVVTGVAPGTNTLSVHWLYLGNGVSGVCTVRIIVVPARPLVYPTTPLEGSVVTWEGLSIEANWLSTAIEEFIPAESQKLLVLTECFAGNVALSAAFRNAPNTCILAATVQNQTGKYGGYHDDAARALKPEGGRTARTVHTQGVKGKKTAPPGTTNTWLYRFENSEWPITGGTLPPEAFLLEPITPTSQVQSRHIIIFMGQPETKEVRIENHDGVTVPLPRGAPTQIDDNADREAIIQNFAGQPNTTVVTLGGGPSRNNPDLGTNGWGMPGTSYALGRALEAAGAAIRASENPAREQFILFVGDHGDLGIDAAPFRTNATAHRGTRLPAELPIVSGDDVLYRLLRRDTNSTPLVTVNVEPASGGQLQDAAAGFPLANLNLSGPYALRLVDPQSGSYLDLTDWSRFDFDADRNGQVEPAAQEFVGLVFPVSEFALFSQFLGKNLSVEFINNSAADLALTGLRLDYGKSPRTNYPLPPPFITKIQPGNGSVALTIEALQFERYIVDRSTNLLTWTPILTNQPFAELSTIQVPAPADAKSAAYRLRWADPLAP
jgi:hypothetical protein